MSKNIHRSALRALLASAMLAATSLAIADEVPTRIKVIWAPTDKLSEVKQNQMHRGWLRPDEWMKSLGGELSRRADAQLPAGEQLDVTIDDIKLAGDYEPWHGPAAQDIRFMKDIYPPRIDLHYKLTDATGRTIRESQSKLRDLSYLQNNVVPTDSDPLRYDKRLIDRWIKTEFRADKT